MPPPDFVARILGLRNGVPNNADIGGASSLKIAEALYRLVIGVAEPRTALAAEAAGTELEKAVEAHLAIELPALDPSRAWNVSRRREIADFRQYGHIARLNQLIREDRTLWVELGRDYVIKPDVTIGVDSDVGRPWLHAAVSCKWTIRSDRVQNVRHEAVIMTRSRRGRLPHIVAVTAEPLPTRLASIAMGTGDVDAVYHVALEELVQAVGSTGLTGQIEMLEMLMAQNRLLDFSLLGRTLTTT